LRRAFRADTVEAALVGACDGELSVVQILEALATLLEQHAGELRKRYLPRVADLLAEGFLEPVETGSAGPTDPDHPRGG
jgi:hypothetical protein